MTKSILGGIVGGIVLLLVLGALPTDNVTDSNSAVKNAIENHVTDKVIDSSGQVMKQVSEQAIDNACKDPNSNSCTTTKTSFSIIGIAWIVIIAVIILDGLVGFSKWIIRTAEFVSDLIPR